MLALRDIMTADVATLNPDDTLRDAINMLTEQHITGAPVVSGTDVVGVISAMDIIDFASTALRVRAGAGEGDEDWEEAPSPDTDSSTWFADAWGEPTSEFDHDEEFHDVLEDHTVDEAMTRNLLMLPPQTEIHVAAAFMIEHGVHRLLVAGDGTLEGLVTTTDFLRLVAERRL